MYNMSCLARRSLILRGIDRNTRELFHQTWMYTIYFFAMSLISPYFQLISLPSCNDRGAVTYNFGLSAEEGGPNKQGRTDFLSSTNR